MHYIYMCKLLFFQLRHIVYALYPYKKKRKDKEKKRKGHIHIYIHIFPPRLRTLYSVL